MQFGFYQEDTKDKSVPAWMLYNTTTCDFNNNTISNNTNDKVCGCRQFKSWSCLKQPPQPQPLA